MTIKQFISYIDEIKAPFRVSVRTLSMIGRA